MFRKPLKPKNMWLEALVSCIALGLAILIVSFFSSTPAQELFGRFFFQTIAIFTFVWVINGSNVLYSKDDIEELEKSLQNSQINEKLKPPAKKEFEF